MTSNTTLAAALAAGTVVLDGGMSNQLESAGHDLSDELWSARLLAERPDAIVEAHLAYFEAGADVAITSSYQATFEGFAGRGIAHERAGELIGLSVELAREAARRASTGGVTRPLWVAASVGPYGAMLADGSEYRGRYGLSVDELERFHRPRLEVLAVARPDVLALETVPDADEARALLRAVRGLGVPAWLSYTVAGERTRAGAAAGGGVRPGRRGGRGDRGGRELLRARGRRGGRRDRRACHGQAGGRLPEQRRGLGRRGPRLEGPLQLLRRAGPGLAGFRGPADRRVLPGGPGGDLGDRRDAGGGVTGTLAPEFLLPHPAPRPPLSPTASLRFGNRLLSRCRGFPQGDGRPARERRGRR